MKAISRIHTIAAASWITAALLGGCMHDESETIVEPVPNSQPVAAAGNDARVTLGVAATLDGTSSSDADGDALSYNWTLTTQPDGSAATVTNATSAQATFTPDVGGVYVASLVVNDGALDSTADTVTIAAGVRVPEYIPIDANVPCTWTYRWTSGPSANSIFTAATVGTATVSYKSGALEGVWFENQGEQNRILVYKDGTRVRYLGFAEFGDVNAFLGTNCDLDAPPKAFDFDIAYNGLKNDASPHYSVTQEAMPSCDGPDTSLIVYTVQDVTVNGTTYDDALIMWWLDDGESYKTISGLDAAIIMPTSAQTGGAAVTDISIFAKDIGPVLQIGVAAESGQIPEAYRYESRTCS
jgi:hypothetical protein